MRRTALAVLVLAAGVSRPAAAPAPDSFRFTPDTTVRIDAAVFDRRGRFLDMLTARDFVVSEDGVPQTLEAVRLVRQPPAAPNTSTVSADPAAPDEQAAAKRPGTRLFALYLDEYHVSPAGAERIRPALTEFVNSLGPTDLLAVMKPLDSILAIRLTSDRTAARDAIAAFTGRRGEYQPRNDYEREFMASTPAAIDQARMQITLSAVEALAVHLGWASADARKSLVVVTSELSRGQRRRGLPLPTVDSISRAANRFNVAVYPIDPDVESPGEPAPAGPDVLTTIASETDGQAVRGSDDLASGFRQVVADASTYYLITYKSPKMIDGRFHDVQIRVKRQNARVRARRGYWAMSGDELMRAELAARAAMPKTPRPVEPPRHISTMIRAWFGVSRGQNGRTRVTFVWEPVHLLGDRGRRVAARLDLTAFAADDSQVFEGEVMPTGPGAVDGDGGPLRAVFEVPPGYLRLRMAIRDGAERLIDSDVRDISVRDLAGPVVIATPEVLRARNAREFRALENEPQAAPVVAREFSRTEHLLIRVRAYAATGGRPAVTARLLSRLGQEMRPLDVVAGAGDEPDRIDLPLAPFAAGDYSIEIRAAAAGGESRELLNFRVTS